MRRIAQYPRRQGRVWLAQLCALAIAVGVLSFLELPLAATTIAKADPPPPPSELVGQRTASSRTFDNHDGTYTTSLYSGPVHYRDVQGAWRTISSAVVPTTDSDDYALQNEANRFRTLFKSTLANDFLALETGGARFKVTLQNAAQVAAQAGPRKVTYPGVFSGVDLRYELRPDGVKETLLLQNAQAQTSYRFLLTPPANARIHAAQGADGSWAFFMAPHARPVFVIDAPWAAENDDPDPRRRNASLAVTRIGDVFALDLSVDGTWFRAAGRQFPVRLDPTITIQPTIQDASFDFGCMGCAGVSSDRLSIGTQGLSAKWRSAVQFSLSDIPGGASVSSAKLKLYFDGTCLPGSGSCGGTSHSIDALRMTSSWSAGSKASELVFNSTPLTSFTLPASASAQWMNWTITSTVQNWVSGSQPNFGLLLKRATEPASASGPKPASRNYAAEPTLGPTLEVTYNGDGGELLEPETVHANGAELRWIPYGGPSAPPFSSYEVHRSASAIFTPSDSTRLTKILDAAVTSYRDTTAKAGGTFTYKVVVNGYETNWRTVTMPVAGEARKVLRPDPAAGRGTYVTFRSDYTECVTRGEAERLKVGTDTSSIFRAFLRFDLREMPTDTTVSQAALSLWHPETTGASALTIRAHRVTGTWPEGTGKIECTGDGPTWYETTGGVDWLTQGGDFDPSVVGTISVPAVQLAGWNTLNIASLAQEWARGQKPNQGLLFKLDNETIGAGKFVDYYADDFSVAPTLRPKLSLTYTETTSASVAPRVNVSKPRPAALVKGTSVELAAAAWDDRRVDSVQFFVDGNSVGTDTSEPFSITWNSTTVANGSHNLTAKATDDAGNQTTSAPVSVTVGNSAAPTTSITSPLSNAIVTGIVTVNANASDDIAITKVELYADGLLVGTDTTSPYSFSWNTLDPGLPAYDGPHTLTTKAYDAHEQLTTSAPVAVMAANAAGTKYLADLGANRIPGRVVYDSSTPSQQQYAVAVTVTNRSTVVWAPGEIVLRYRWLLADGTSTDSGNLSLGASPLLPNGSTIVNVLLEAPSLPAGTARSNYRLRFDLFEPGTSTWFGTRGDKPLEEGVVVGERNQEPALGVEAYYQYDTEQLGVGMEQLVNVATGNSIVRWTPFQAPGRGLSTVVELSYNSGERDCNHNFCPAGEGWSLAISSLTRFGMHAFKVFDGNDNGQADEVDLIDADGTLLVFSDANEDGAWTPPGGTHLYLRRVANYPGEPAADWALTRPDRTTYFYDEMQDEDEDGDDDTHGFPVSVRDKNANRIEFVRGTPPHHNKHVVKVKDAGLRSFTLDYYEKGPHNGRLERITDHLGHKLEFFYGNSPQQGHLTAIVEIGGTNADGTPLPDRRIEFQYENGPHGRLEYVRDPLGAENPSRLRTHLVYGSAGRLTSRTDRVGAETTFAYNVGASETMVTAVAALNRVTKYHFLTTARDMFSVDTVRRYRNYPLENSGETTQTVWTPTIPPPTCSLARSPARHIWKVIEPSGAYTERCYNQNGLVTDEWDQLRNWTLSTYEDSCVDGSTSDSNRSLSDLTNRKTPRGNTWTYEYWRVPSACSPGTMPNGNLFKVIDPVPPPNQGVTTYTYDQANNWNLDTVTDANGNPTTYRDYDANGFPTRVTDAENQVTKYSYDADGMLRTMQDPLHPDEPVQNERFYKTVYDHDSFHRLGRQSSPKSTRFEFGTLIWAETSYDANNNVVREIQPYYGSDPRRETRSEYDAMDRQTCLVEPQLPTQTAQPEITLSEYDAAGRLTRTTAPKGVTPPLPPAICPTTPQGNDYVTESVYDAFDRVVTEKRYDESGNADRKTRYCYQHNTGDLLWVVAPKSDWDDQNPPDCNVNSPPSHTIRYTYDAAHQQKTETARAGPGEPLRTREQWYDANGNVEREDDEEDTRTTYEYTERDELNKTVETFRKDAQHTPTRTLTTYLQYDKVGNLILEASPRAWDKEQDPNPDPDPIPPEPGDDYVVEYRYDLVDRLNRIAMADDQDNTRKYIHRAYDPDGNLKRTTLPVEASELGTLCDPGNEPDKCTDLSYWDAGLIRTSEDHILTPVLYDYAAEGWQTHRFSDRAQGSEMSWAYFPDGMLARAVDRQGQPADYIYDRNDNLVMAVEARSQGRRPRSLTIESEYNGYDEPTKTRIKDAGEPNWRFTRYSYDRNGNLDTRRDDGLETGAGAELEPPRLHDYAYNEVDELTEQLDLGTDGQLGEGDRQLVRSYEMNGWQRDETLARYTNGSWQARRSTAWTFFANGDLETLTTHSGGLTPPAPVVEKHTLDYEQCPNPDVSCTDADRLYLNGNRISDEFQLVGPDDDVPTGCEDKGDCALEYQYGPRENLTREKRSRSSSTTWTCHQFDAAQNMVEEWVMTQPQSCDPQVDDPTRTFQYLVGNRLHQMTDIIQQRTSKYFYDDDGNLECVTTNAWAGPTCPNAAGQGASQVSALVEDLDWHYSGRLASYRRYDSGEQTDSADYDHDPLDRLYEETETHGEAPSQTTSFFYRGPSDLVRSEAAGVQEKRYTYTAEDSLLALDNDPGGGAPTESRAYAANVHTDVSLLLDAGQSSSEVKATYGYKVYGGEDLNLTRGLASEVQRNPYRFNAKRLDSGSATLDMGARRYNNDYGRFIQRDAFMESESDLALDLGARTQNRSLFAASNPVNLIEVDGHDAIGRLRDAFRGLRDAMTDADVRWCRSNIPTCIKVAETVIDAYTYMNLKRNGGHFGRDRSEGRADAFRHCCWSGLMSLTVGSETAATVGKNHEDFPRPSFRERNSKSMDLHNNFIGRQIGDKAFVKTPGKLDALVVQQLGMGMWKELLVVDDCMKQTKPGGRLWMLSRRCIADGRDIGSRLIWPDGRLVVPSAPKAARGLTCSERPVRRRGGF